MEAETRMLRMFHFCSTDGRPATGVYARASCRGTIGGIKFVLPARGFCTSQSHPTILSLTSFMILATKLPRNRHANRGAESPFAPRKMRYFREAKGDFA